VNGRLKSVFGHLSVLVRLILKKLGFFKSLYDLIIINFTIKLEITQASFNTMRYKGRDSAAGIGRKLSIIRPGANNVVVS
jgi:hypothetical protein